MTPERFDDAIHLDRHGASAHGILEALTDAVAEIDLEPDSDVNTDPAVFALALLLVRKLKKHYSHTDISQAIEGCREELAERK